MRYTRTLPTVVIIALHAVLLTEPCRTAQSNEFWRRHCYSCHDADSKQGGLDLSSLPTDLTIGAAFSKWVLVYDRLASGEMPPKDQPRPNPTETATALKKLKLELVHAERTQRLSRARTGLRRLTRAEYENTIRDLFDMPGIALQGELPPDGSAHGFDKNSDALDISHVNLAKYLEAADHVLDLAITVQPQPPTVKTQRISLANPHGFVAHVLMHGDGVLLKDKRPDPEFPPPDGHVHLDQGAHERMGSFHNGASVGLFRHEDESFHPYFNEFVAIYPARYRLRTSLWSFQWDKGQVRPARGIEVARLSIVQLTGDGRGGGHPSTVLAYLDAPSLDAQTHEITTWLNPRETIGFNAASLISGHTRGQGGVMNFTGPGITCDYLEVEGPLYDSWPPLSHRLLFGDLPLVEFTKSANPQARPPKHDPYRQRLFMGRNVADQVSGVWTIDSTQPLADADRLLASFLPKAFRRPVTAEIRQAYLEHFRLRLEAGECFETALRSTYRAALCSPDFLYHVEATAANAKPADDQPVDAPPYDASTVDDYALACRLAYFLWNSLPDDELVQRAAAGKLRRPEVLRAEVNRLLQHSKSQRFIDDFLGQWLKLRQIAANDPDNKLYPEFRPYLQDSMVAETRAYFRELLEKDLNASHLVKSDFAMVNEKLAVHYDIEGVTGSRIRRVLVPAGNPRGPFLTQAAILKVTANGTTTSPVPRGAFVMDRLLGQPPEAPPANVAAVEPDVRGATTIREQLAKHRDNVACASCHAKLDPPGFALEMFDVIGGQRNRYRSIGTGDPAPRGKIDPLIGISFKLGPAVDASGQLPDGRSFKDVGEFQSLIAGDSQRLTTNLARRLLTYATGRPVTFSDRDAVDAAVTATLRQGGGIRTLVHEIVQSPLFRTR